MSIHFKISLCVLFVLLLSARPADAVLSGYVGDVSSSYLLPAALPPQTHAPLRFSHLSIEQGLSTNEVWAALRDQQGFMWFGTLEGLNRYDGYNFKVFRHDENDPHSLSENTIRTLYLEATGTLWVGTWTGGLNRFDRATETFTAFQHDPGDPTSLSSNNVYSILQDAQGSLWVGTRGGGLNRFDPRTQSFTRIPNGPSPNGLASDTVFAIARGENNMLWVGGNAGLAHVDPVTGLVTNYQHDPANPASLVNNLIRAAFPDRDGSLWVGTASGIDHFDPQTETFTHYRVEPGEAQNATANTIFSIQRDSRGRLWVGTVGNGLYYFDEPTNRLVPLEINQPMLESIRTAEVYQVFDDARTVWFTSNRGVFALDLNPKPFYTLQHDGANENSLSGISIDSVYQDPDGILWVSTASSGLNRVNRQTGEVKRYRHNPDDPTSLGIDAVWSIAPGEDGILWLALFGGGLDRFDPKTESFTHFRHDPTNPHSLSSNQASFVARDASGILWIGTIDAGLNRLNPKDGTFTQYPYDAGDPSGLSDAYISYIYPGTDGTLWLGTLAGGVNRLDPATGKITVYRNETGNSNSLSPTLVTGIYQDRTGKLWIGTWGGGLNQLDLTTGTVHHFRTADGLPGDAVAAVQEDTHGNLWVSTNHGLARYDSPAETFRTYDSKDGLPTDSFIRGASFSGSHGELFFGTAEGLVAFQPEDIHDNPTPPPIAITNLLLNNQAVPIGANSVLPQSILDTRAVTLSYLDRVISFEFAALSYTNPSKSRYRYMLEGFDTDWIETDSTRRFATYTNLDPGNYIFRVLGTNEDGVWNDQGASLRVTITPPWWETTAFRSGIAVLLLTALVAAFVWQRHSSITRERQLEALVTERTKELEQATAQIRSLYQNTHLGIGMTTEQGNFIAANPALLTMLGYSEAELKQVQVSDTYADSTQRRNVFAELADKGRIQDLDAPLVRKDGSHFDARLNLSRLNLAQGPVLLAVLEDITEQKHAAEALRTSERLASERAAVEAERNRLARELHDSVTQSLYSANLIAEALPTVWERHPDEARQSLGELHQLTQAALAEMRTLLLELRPGAFAERSLGDLLRQLTDSLEARTNVSISTWVVGNYALPPDVQIAFYRIAQEGLNNILKHSRATRAWVNLNCDDGQVIMHLGDDGKGFDENNTQPHQLGLKFMRERAAVIGAALSIEHPHTGTEIIVAWTRQIENQNRPQPSAEPETTHAQ